LPARFLVPGLLDHSEQRECDLEPGQYSDDVKRLADSVNMHAYLGHTGQWAAYKLQDCSTDHAAYPNRREAVRILWPNQDFYFYVYIPPSGMSLQEADIYLRWNRALYENGFRMPDPDDAISPDAIPTMPITREDAKRQLRLLTKR
jgi:hypothetical protein